MFFLYDAAKSVFNRDDGFGSFLSYLFFIDLILLELLYNPQLNLGFELSEVSMRVLSYDMHLYGLIVLSFFHDSFFIVLFLSCGHLRCIEITACTIRLFRQ